MVALKAHEADVELKLSLAAGLPEMTADPRAFNQVLINLISNAVKFTPPGGRVTVSALRDGAKLVLTVADTGVGISEADLPRLGEAFFQAHASFDRRRDGSGLGLSIVKNLVQLHDGEVEIQSRLGEGTRVTVRLPFECEAARSAANPVKLVPERNRELPMTANDRVKKRA
jgi:cell cycle sensor histidine kinase DivJ